MSFIVCNELFVDKPDAEVFERNFGASMRGTLAEVPGLVAARLLAPTAPDRGYLSMLEFTDRGAYARYLDSEWFSAAHHWPDHAPIAHNRLSAYETVLAL
jgi:heme-degrading monooxygenase HmoA